MKTIEQIHAEIKKIPASQAKRHDEIKEVLDNIVDWLGYIRIPTIREVVEKNFIADPTTITVEDLKPRLEVQEIPKKEEKMEWTGGGINMNWDQYFYNICEAVALLVEFREGETK